MVKIIKKRVLLGADGSGCRHCYYDDKECPGKKDPCMLDGNAYIFVKEDDHESHSVA